MRQQGELAALTEATYHARWNATARMQAGTDALQADGIVGVRPEWRPHVTALARIEGPHRGPAGRPHRQQHHGDRRSAITAADAEKAARFLQLCDTFGIHPEKS